MASTVVKVAQQGIVMVPDNSISTAKIQDGSVTLAKLAADSVDSSKIVNDSIVNAKIQDGSVTLAKLAADSVDSSKIVNDSIVNADVKTDAAIDISKISGGVTSATVGNLLTANQATGTDTLGNTTGFVDQGGSPTFVSSTDEAVSGTKSLKVTWNGASTNYIEISGTAANNWFAVTPGSTITVKAMNKAGADTWAYRAFWYQANQTQSATSSTVQSVATQSASWHAADATFVAPADAAFMWVMLYRNDGVDGDITYFDNLSVHFGAGGQWALPGTPITNLGFYADESVGRRLFQWDANNSRWQQTYGDTGWRDITSHFGALPTGLDWSNTDSTTVLIRRVNNTVSIGFGYRYLKVTQATGTAVWGAALLPSGFRANTHEPCSFADSTGGGYVEPALGGYHGTYGLVFNWSGMTVGSQLPLTWTYHTSDAWPTTLPGTASGSIPS